MQRPPIYTRLSPTTGDYSQAVKEYLISKGHPGCGPIGLIEVWTRREHRCVVAVGGSRAEVDKEITTDHLDLGIGEEATLP